MATLSWPRTLALLALLLIPLGTANGDSPRTWTEATFVVGVDGGQARLRRADARRSPSCSTDGRSAPKVIEGEVVAIADGDMLLVLEADVAARG